MTGSTSSSFEDGLASTEDFDGDFDDAFVAVSDTPLSRQTVKELVEETDISRRVGTDGKDRLVGTNEDDQLIGLDGNDVIRGRRGDDQIEAGDGNDRAYGGGATTRSPARKETTGCSAARATTRSTAARAATASGAARARTSSTGGEGRDRLHGGNGFDEIKGGEGNDWLWAGGGGARMSGGADDDTLIGEAGAKDVFVFDLIPFGDDLIRRFENGSDRIEIATYTGVESFDDIDVTQEGQSTVLTFAEGTVEIANFNATRIDASDFLFV